MKRLFLALLLAPLLLAPVRLKDSTPGFFTPPSIGPAPESYSLPAAEPLTTPTVIMVSPTILIASPSEVVIVTATTVTPSTINLPLPANTPVQKVVIIQQAAPNLMPVKSAALCIKSMQLTQNIAMLSYGQKRNQPTMTLALASSAAAGEASNRSWPNLTAFDNAAGDLPWFQPQKTELHDALTAARRLCSQ